MRCIQVCEKIQGMSVWDIFGSGYRTTVGVKGNDIISNSKCVLCGQCVTHCPVGALNVKDDKEQVYDAIADKNTITMVQIAPAVRTAWAEQLGLSKEESTMGKMVSALRKIGFDYIFDTNYAADMTIMEEGSEFIERFTNKSDYNWPMFTSCCPGWIRFIKQEYPEYIPNLSTAKSPQQIFGALSKTYIAEKLGKKQKKIFSVSIMPCMAKKFERGVPQVNDTGFDSDVDLVLTTRELATMIKADSISTKDLKDEPFDEFFGEGTGAAVIFGVTGGVMEAALRSAYYLITGENPKPDSFSKVRGKKGWKEVIFDIQGRQVRVAVVSGLLNTRNLIKSLKKREVEYDFVEVMACPGGCSGGGGQPIIDGEEKAEERGKILYGLDSNSDIRFSHDNPVVNLTYEEFLGQPLSPTSHRLLHTDVSEWDIEIK